MLIHLDGHLLNNLYHACYDETDAHAFDVVSLPDYHPNNLQHDHLPRAYCVVFDVRDFHVVILLDHYHLKNNLYDSYDETDVDDSFGLNLFDHHPNNVQHDHLLRAYCVVFDVRGFHVVILLDHYHLRNNLYDSYDETNAHDFDGLNLFDHHPNNLQHDLLPSAYCVVFDVHDFHVLILPDHHLNNRYPSYDQTDVHDLHAPNSPDHHPNDLLHVHCPGVCHDESDVLDFHASIFLDRRLKSLNLIAKVPEFGLSSFGIALLLWNCLVMVVPNLILSWVMGPLP
jgi:hypothetical protein